MRIMCAALLLSACGVTWIDEMPVRATHDTQMLQSSELLWKARVRADVEEWGDRLEAIGCARPFRYSEEAGAGEIRLVQRNRWTHGRDVGHWSHGLIEIRAETDGTIDRYASDPQWIVLRHELGHAMGLQHVDYDLERPTIMTARGPMYEIVDLPDADVASAGHLIGCL